MDFADRNKKEKKKLLDSFKDKLILMLYLLIENSSVGEKFYAFLCLLETGAIVFL